MATFLQDLEVNMIIKEVQIQDAAKKKLDDMTRLRLGLPATGPVAFPAGAREATASAMKSAATGGGIGGLIAQITTLTSGILSLAGILMMAISNSKIIAMLSNTIGKALGLLVDVILMPFLPIFMILLVGLFKGIMLIYKWWKEWWDSPGMKIILNWVKGVLGGKSTEPTGETATVMINATDDAKWWKNLITGGISTVSINFMGILDSFMAWFWGSVMNRNGVPATTNFDIVANFMIGAGEAIYAFLTGHKGGEPIPLVSGTSGLEGMPHSWDLTNAIDYGGGPAMLVPSAASGGTVSKTGIAKVHKGETIGKGGITVNITGQFKTDEEMYKRFVDRLRQEQWRTNV